MKEIGGYFGLETFSGREYHEGLLALNNGRSCLAYLLKARNIRRLWLPRYLCDSVSGVCQREACEYRYYAVGPDFLPAEEIALEDGEYLYIVNYYGQLSNAQAIALKERYGRIIFDNVHAFFQPPVPGIDTVYSCRKFFGVPDGGYLATDVRLEEALEQDVSKDRMRHVLGRFEGIASDYHADFKANDHSFKTLPPLEMSALTHNLLRAIDYEAVRIRRNDNFARLHAALGERNPLTLTVPDGPYAYPFYCKDGMALKKALAAEKIYVATLWPNVLEMGSDLEKDYTRNILPLPCDQRYDGADMDRIIHAVLAWIHCEETP